MTILKPPIKIPENIILGVRIFTGLVWFGTVIRRLSTGVGEFELRISAMSEGETLFPSWFMEFAVTNWWVFFGIVLALELISSLSLLTGTFARGGALLATLNGFAIGMAGIGVGLIDLIIPWSVAFITLLLLLFTRPGRVKGFDSILKDKDIPKLLLWFT